jgi:crotonobetainyl-CoA:carnitine CoA-transferase CaiB-like acyl-CoA transferase
MPCSKILADLGVDVIKVGKPWGDPARYFPPFYHDKPSTMINPIRRKAATGLPTTPQEGDNA